MELQKPRRSGVICAAVSFVAVVAIWVVVSIVFGFYPFGKYSILITDMSQQYVEFFLGFYDTVHQGTSLLFTWNSGMGMNTVGLWAYYLTSPLSLLVLLFPRTMIMEALLVLVTLKIGLMALAFSIMTSRLFGLRSFWNPLLSCAYALCGFVVTYFYSIMWLDGVILLPLIVLATCHLLRTKKMVPLVVALFFLFISNFYIGYMVGLFTFLLVMVILHAETHTLRQDLGHLGRFFGAAGIAAALAAFLLVPTYFALQTAESTSSPFQLYFAINFNPVQLFGKLAVGAYDSATGNGTPNVYAGVFSLVGIAAWLTNRSIRRREKYVVSLLFLFLLVSMTWYDLDVAWHGFQPPTWFPFRYSFAFSFLTLASVARSLSRPEGLRLKPLWIGTGVWAVLMPVASLITPEPFAGKLWLTVALLAVYGLLLAAWLLLRKSESRRFLRRVVAGVFCLVFCAELGYNAYTALSRMNGEFLFTFRDEYASFMKEGLMRSKLVKKLDDSGFYRMENDTPRNSNDNFSSQYHGVTHFSSMSNSRTFLYLKQLGMDCSGGDQFLHYTGATSLLDSILGVKYLYSKDAPRMAYSFTGHSVGEYHLYDNAYALPLAFGASSRVLQLQPEGKNPFEQQNHLVSDLLGKTTACYQPLYFETKFQKPYKKYDSYYVSSEKQDITFTVTVPKATHLYAYIPGNESIYTTIAVNGELLYRPRMLKGVLDLGEVPEGMTTVIVPISKERYFEQPDFYAADVDVFTRSLETLQAQASQDLKVGETSVSGSITMAQDGAVFTSIPADSGWRAVVDGKPVKLSASADAFLSFPMPKGTHTFTLTFFPKGLMAGIVISSVTLILCLAVLVFRWRKRNIKHHTISLPPVEAEKVH